MPHVLRRDLVILACAVSSGVHAALMPEHFRERAAAGLGFLVAAVALAALAVAVSLHPTSARLLVGATGVFAGLLVGYALATTTGMPVLHPDPEPVDGLALATKAIEAVGLLAASSLVRWPSAAGNHPQPKGT
jgi:hypothetical protein